MHKVLSLVYLLNLLLINHTAYAENNNTVVESIKQAALGDDYAYHLIESLTTEVGPRLVGSQRSLDAINWAEAQLKEIGLTQISKQPVKVRNWQRISASAEILSPYSHQLVVVSLGGSVPTVAEGLEVDVIRFSSVEHLKSASAEEVGGKIVYVAKKLTQDKSGDDYIRTVKGRQDGAIVAAQLGAKAIIIRSITTDNSRIAHTGSIKYLNDVNKIPAASISAADADLLDRLFSRNLTPRLKLNLQNSETDWVDSFNLIADLVGNEKADEIVLLAAHLDSWDLGTGALDDAAGIGIMLGTVKQIMNLNMPMKRTIRLVFYTDSQFNQSGVRQYIRQNAEQLDKIVVATESDSGAGVIWRLDTKIAIPSLQYADEIHTLVSDLAIERGHNLSLGSTNTAHLAKNNVPIFHFAQDMTNYFKYLHSANDTFDKIKLNSIQQNVATYSIFTYMVANSDISFRNTAVN